MKLFKIFILLIIPILSFSKIEYIKLNHLDSVSEDNLTRITKINNQTFEYFKIYMDNKTFSNLNLDCLVKFDTKRNDVTLSSGKPFLCSNTYYEFINKEVNPLEYQSFEHFLDSFIYEFLLSNIGKLIALIGFLITFIIYMISHKGAVLLIGVVISLIVGFIIGFYTMFTIDYPVQKFYLVDFYDKIEKKEGQKVFRKGFYPYRITKTTKE